MCIRDSINSAISISNWVKQQNEKVHLICGMMNDKPHKEFVNQFENSVNSITLIDIPNQKGSISKEEFKKKLGNKNINTAGSIYASSSINIFITKFLFKLFFRDGTLLIRNIYKSY